MIPHKHVVKIGRGVRHLSRLRGGSGSALPGLVVEKLDPAFAARVLGELPQGVVVITGTNGKTTTTKMVVKLLTDNGLKVFSNRTGSNFTRGIIATLLGDVDPASGMLDADIAVLELDEAYAAKFVKLIRPRYSLLLNVMRDQLDRFGEIDYTAGLLRTVAEATTEGIVLNRDDPLVASLADDVPSSIDIRYFSLEPKLKKLFPDDQSLYSKRKQASNSDDTTNDVRLEKVSGQRALFSFNRKATPPVTLKIQGIYNIQNAAAALSLSHMILGSDTPPSDLLSSLAQARPAFGRGEAVAVDGHPLEIVLVKNPAGFRLALSSYVARPARTMIAINDNYADGRDMSWLWDVDFKSLEKVAIVSGIRAYDMALRLQYDDVEVGQVDTSLKTSLDSLLSGKPGPRRIYCTYTAMMSLRRLLAKQFNLEEIDV